MSNHVKSLPGIHSSATQSRKLGYIMYPFTNAERIERVVFLIAMVVVLLDVFIWRVGG